MTVHQHQQSMTSLPVLEPHSRVDLCPAHPTDVLARTGSLAQNGILQQAGRPSIASGTPVRDSRTVVTSRHRQPWRHFFGVPLTAASVFAALTVLTAVAAGLPLRDPDRLMGPSYLRLPVIVAAMIALDVLPRALRQRPTPQQLVCTIMETARSRWSPSRLAVATAGLASFYLAYVAYRNLKSFLPFLQQRLTDPALTAADRWLTGGTDPAEVLHHLLGTGFSAGVLSTVYVSFLLFVPVSLTAALIWCEDLARGAWYATALSLNWILGTLTYYALPSLGPVYADPSSFAELPRTPVTTLQETLLHNRVEVLADPHTTTAMHGIAAFASLHVSIVFTAALITHRLGAPTVVRAVMWIYLALTGLATIYFGWHYLLDVPAGLAVGAASVFLAARATRFPAARATASPGTRNHSHEPDADVDLATVEPVLGAVSGGARPTHRGDRHEAKPYPCGSQYQRVNDRVDRCFRCGVLPPCCCLQIPALVRTRFRCDGVLHVQYIESVHPHDAPVVVRREHELISSARQAVHQEEITVEKSIMTKSFSERAKDRLYEAWDAWKPGYEDWLEWSNSLYAPDAVMIAMDGDKPELFRDYQAKMQHFRDQFTMEMGVIDRCIVADGITAHTYQMYMTPKGQGKDKTVVIPVTEFNHFAEVDGYDKPMVVKLELITAGSV
jgi:hypothetical protein